MNTQIITSKLQYAAVPLIQAPLHKLKGFQVPGDVWGGVTAMMVALPSAVAFGVTIFAVIGPEFVPFGALAGIIGTFALGIVASTLGGTDRLITAPCAPAAALLSAFALGLVQQETAPLTVVLMVTVMSILTGAFQVMIGMLKVGNLIKYIPYTVVSGYLTGVGMTIIGSQIPKFLGVTNGAQWWKALITPASWDYRALAIGGTTALVMAFGPRLTKAVPGTILGILSGLLVYFIAAAFDPALMTLENNHLVIGSLGSVGGGFLDSIMNRWNEIGDLRLSQLAKLFGSALTLAALLSIDTLKTCVVLDQMTRSRHDSNRELVAQGVANMFSSAVGGVCGAGQMGSTLVNLVSGAQTRISGIVEGIAALIAALLLNSFISWIPVASLAGILIVVGIRMIDKEPLLFLKSRDTVFDFAVVAAVVVVALTVSLIGASATGVLLSILLFVREQVGGSVVRNRYSIHEFPSRRVRSEEDTQVLDQLGGRAVVYELQGSLFFGTTYQFYTALEPDLKTAEYIILDFRRVTSMDVTAAHTLHVIQESLKERNANLLFSDMRTSSSGRDLKEFLDQTGITTHANTLMFPGVEAAIEWVEGALLAEVGYNQNADQTPLLLHEIDVFKSHAEETLQDLTSCITERSLKAGELIYKYGQPGNEIYFVRKGCVNVQAFLSDNRLHHLSTIGRGDFFGGLSFLDGKPRSNEALVVEDVELYVLSRESFLKIAEQHKRLAINILTALTRTLTVRLRNADNKLRMLYD
ncbi:MAG: SLC26A/SulP transporter family protein [Magnetococcales bacterium]|nr:SLC26A/SulP transporter family protein [Magnetococcales bacterium]